MLKTKNKTKIRFEIKGSENDRFVCFSNYFSSSYSDIEYLYMFYLTCREVEFILKLYSLYIVENLYAC